MLLFKALFIVFLSRGLQAQDAIEDDGEPSVKIVGGQQATNGQFPFMASLRRNNGHFCGGTIINARFILTAAHCITSVQASQITVVVGTNSLSSGGTSYGVSKIIKHSGYNPNNAANDIALLQINKNIQMTSTVKAVARSSCLNDNYAYPVTAVGWGYRSTNSGVSNTLQFANLITRTQAQCKRTWSIFTANQICTLYSSRGICFGDSGGPLLYNRQQIGINSYVSGNGCATNVADVYTKVCSYESWINSNSNLS